MRIVAAHGGARDILRAEGLEEQVGDFGRGIAVDDVIEEFLVGIDTNIATSADSRVITVPGAGTVA
jgi:hypothetical protein